MMTIEERDTARAIQTIAREMKKPHEIDWEQRRYEIAKETLSGIASSLPHPYDSPTTVDELSGLSVRYADALIAELKKPINDQPK